MPESTATNAVSYTTPRDTIRFFARLAAYRFISNTSDGPNYNRFN
jgi:hypothetical protein